MLSEAALVVLVAQQISDQASMTATLGGNVTEGLWLL